MYKNNFYISFGLWITILPFLGVPGVWKVCLTSLSGIFLMLYAVGPIILKKLEPKVVKQRRKNLSKPTEFQNPIEIKEQTEPAEQTGHNEEPKMNINE